MNYKNLILAWLLLFFISGNLFGANKSRIALVIGNDRYESSVGSLRNSGNDAKAVAKALRSLGFSVTERHNLKRELLLQSVDEFRKSLAGAEVALFYYAGHGISINGANYLIPIDSGFNPVGADSASLRMLAETHLFNVEQAVVDMTSGGAKCNLAILDACRTTRLAINRDRDINNHGTLVEMTSPTGSLIAFSTDSGHSALDGDGKNGLYTEELLNNLLTPGITIEQVFKRTRSGVIRRSQGAQVPAEYSRLVGEDIYLAGEQPSTPQIMQASPVVIPIETHEESLAAIQKLAIKGSASATECINRLKELAQREGPGDYTISPINTLLEQIKIELKSANGPSTKVITASEACEIILQALPLTVPSQTPRFLELSLKAHNRKGDALLLLGHADKALIEFNAAAQIQPNDPYVLLNRGKAYLALGQSTEARIDLEASIKNADDHPKAKQLARQALLELK